MASQRCLVADCGFCFATSALAPLASRRGKNWKSECPLKWFGWLKIIDSKVFFLTRMSMLQTFFDDSCKYQHFCLLPSKIRISNSSPLQGCFVFPRRSSVFTNSNELHKVLKWHLPTHSVDLSLQRPIDMILDLPILQNPWARIGKNKLIHQPKGVGCQKVLFKTD